MSISWGVVPSQPQEPGFCDWLIKAGLEIPAVTGRFPSLNELREVLQSLNVVPIREDNYEISSYSISIGELYSKQYAHMLGSVKDDKLFHFQFWGSGCHHLTMMEILKRLTAFCGPFVLYESGAATPVIIESSTRLADALDDWVKRTDFRYSDNEIEK